MLEIITEKTKIAYSVEEISEQTSLSKAFLRLEIKRGKLKIKRFGRRVLIRDEDLREYIANGSNGGQMELNQ
jgi:excisionase family DNA binding protein